MQAKSVRHISIILIRLFPLNSAFIFLLLINTFFHRSVLFQILRKKSDGGFVVFFKSCFVHSMQEVVISRQLLTVRFISFATYFTPLIDTHNKDGKQFFLCQRRICA